jgi:hypothetical protein
MTEADWMLCKDPRKMLLHLAKGLRNREPWWRRLLVTASPLEWPEDRKLRLFSCACCRGIWHLLEEEENRKTVEVSEGYADGLVSRQEFDAVTEKAADRAVGWSDFYPDCLHRSLLREWGFTEILDLPQDAFIEWLQENGTASQAAAWAAMWAAMPSIWTLQAVEAVRVIEVTASFGPGRKERLQTDAEARAGLLRCIVGPSPFRPLPVPARSLMAWGNGIVKRLAEDVYEHRLLPGGQLDSVRLSVLADALEEAGADAVLLEHLRGPGPHVRGCHVVDLLTGRG